MTKLILKIINNFFLDYKFIRLINYNLRQKKHYHNFSKLNLNKDSIVLDIGANIGKISQYLVDNYNCKIDCYEPNKFAFKILKKTFFKNNNVTCHEKAISKDNGFGNLYYHKLNSDNPFLYSPSSSMLKEKSNLDSNDFDVVETTSLNEVLSQFKIIDLIKIDIEGYEYEILPIILKNKAKIKKVICELHGSNKNLKNNFLNKKFIEFIKTLDLVDPKREWFQYHS